MSYKSEFQLIFTCFRSLNISHKLWNVKQLIEINSPGKHGMWIITTLNHMIISQSWKCLKQVWIRMLNLSELLRNSPKGQNPCMNTCSNRFRWIELPQTHTKLPKRHVEKCFKQVWMSWQISVHFAQFCSFCTFCPVSAFLASYTGLIQLSVASSTVKPERAWYEWRWDRKDDRV